MTFVRGLAVSGSLILLASALGSPATPAVAGAAAAPAARPILSANPGDPELGSLVSGEESYVTGTAVFTDYVYDDRGPNTDVLPGGDEPYPGAPHPIGTADLVQVQVGTGDDGSLEIAALLRTVVPDHDALVGIGIDDDRRASSGAPSLPGGQWANTDPLGLERLVTLGTDGRGTSWRWRGGEWERDRNLGIDVDRQRNVLRTTVADVRPGRATWNVVGVVGRMTSGSWLDGSVPIQDIAYLRAEDPTDIGALSVPQQLPQDNYQPFQDWDQADVLAGRLPAARAVGTVRLGTARSVEPPVRTGFNAFLYHSRVAVPEGRQVTPRVFSSTYQPYGVWIPRSLPRRRPLLVFLHGSNQYQNVNVVYFNNPVDPAGIQPFADLKAITIFPNGRTATWATPLADADALDSIADALARPQLRLDPDRIVVSGISSGGYGTFHMLSRYPDLFSGGYSIVGGANTSSGPRATPLENLTNVPLRASNGAADPLVPYDVWRSSADALDAAGTVDYRTVLIHTGSHNGAVAEGACFLTDLVSRDRVRNPARVRFRVPAVDPELVAIGRQPSGAYWASGLVQRDRAKSGAIDATSNARRPLVVRSDIAEVGQNVATGADFCGPRPTLIRAQTWQTEGRAFGHGPLPAASQRNRLDVTLDNLRTATVDLRRAGLDLGRPVLVTVTGDGRTRLTLGGWPRGSVVVRQDGRRAGTVPVRAGALTLTTEPGGRHVYRLVLRRN
ncbi:MAG: hypothetical protein WB767_02370 [Nocardioides sp.]